jgi:hypothetical protein
MMGLLRLHNGNERAVAVSSRAALCRISFQSCVSLTGELIDRERRRDQNPVPWFGKFLRDELL